MKASLLGTLSPSQFVALFFLAIIGAVLSMLLQTTNRNISSDQTPKHFSWSFFMQDNWKRIVTALLLIYVSLRFAPEILGINITEFVALGIGFSLDKIAQLLKDKTNIFGQKQ